MNDTALVCMACYQNRLASVFENATDFRLFEQKDGTLHPAGSITLPATPRIDTPSAMIACGVKHIVCGAICSTTRDQLERVGLCLTPWLRGEVDEVCAAWADGCLDRMLMPGHPPASGRDN